VDIQAYISSGILESYVMGLATPQEMQEVEAMAAKFPAIRIELEKIETTLHRFARLNSQNPPDVLREKILSHIESEEQALHPSGKKIVDFKSSYSEQSTGNGWKMYAVAASITLLLSVGYNLFQFEKVENSVAESSQAKQELIFVQDSLQALHHTNLEMANMMELMLKPGNKTIEMKGLEKSPNAKALIVWNTVSKEVFLRTETLPLPAADKQYQLWAIVDGKPVDMGIFDLQNSMLLQKMKSVENPQAFAVTLEPKGGSAVPTLNQMFVMGKNG
jgi:anti-sigma-K factor RskA